MGIRAASTRRITASSAQSGDAVVIYSGTTSAYTVGGSAASSVSSGGGGTTITSVVYTDQNYNTLTANAASTTFGYVRILGSGFTSGANIFLSNTSTSVLSNITANTTLINGGEIRANVPSISIGNYTLYVFNSSGSSAIYYSGMSFEPYPLWSTPSSLTSANVSVNIPLSGYVTSTSGVQPITFGLASGNTLPSGLTLSSSGIISGSTTIIGSSQTFYIYITATDLYNETTTSGNIALTLNSSDPQFNVTTMLLNGETNTTSFIADASTNNTAMTIVGNTHPTLTTPYYGDGYYSNYFNGTPDYLSLPINSTIASPGTTYTLEAWLYPTSFSGSPTVYQVSNATVSNFGGMFWQLSTTGQIIYQIRPSTNGTNYNYTTTQTISLNTWTHVALVFNSNSLSIFINGVATSVLNATGFTALDGTQTFAAIGNITNGYSPTQPYYGYISNFRYVKGVALYTGAFTPSTSPLTAMANTALLTCQSSSLIDKSAYNFGLTKTGSVAVSPATPFTTPTSVTVNTGYSVYFNGISDYLSLASSSAFGYGTGNFTVECWVYPTGSFQTCAFIDNRSSGSDTVGFSFGFNNTSGQLGVYTNSSAVLTSSSNLSLNQWYHVAVSRTSGTMTMYINGVSVGSTTYTNSLGTSQPALIGRNVNTSPTNWFQGYISNMRVVNGTGLYTTNFTPSTTPLTAIANTVLLTCQGNTVVDTSTNAFTPTPSGNVKVINNNYPFTAPTATVSNLNTLSATYFNGSTDYLQSTVTGPGTGDFTIEGWAYATTLTSGTPNIFSIVASGSGTGFQVYMSSNNGFGIRSNSANITPNNSGSIAPIANTWYHLAMVRKSGTISLYINGILAASTSTSYTFSDTQFNIGYSPIGTYFTGFIADVRYVNGTALYTSNFAPTYQPLTPVANTQLLTLQYNGGANNGGIVDNSSFNNIITRVGAASLGTFSPYAQTGWSNYFNGSSYLTLTSSTAFVQSGAMTVEMWIYPTAYPGSFDTGLYQPQNPSSTSIALKFKTDGTLYLDNQATGAVVTGATVCPLNTWSHVAMSRNSSGTWYLFVNGVSQGTPTSYPNTTSPTYIVSGFRPDTSTYYTGYISNLRVVQGTALYTAGFTPSITPLTAISGTSLLTDQSNRFKDSSTINSNVAITLTGTPIVQSFSPFAPGVVYSPTVNGGSTYFSGTADYLTAAPSSLFAFGTNNYTVEMWAYPTVSSKAMCLFDTRSTGTSSSGTALAINSTNQPYVYINATTLFTGNMAIQGNCWSHFAMVKNSGIISLYMNGNIIGSAASSTSSSDTYCTIGSTVDYRDTSATYKFSGHLSDVRVTTNAGIYTSNFTPTTTTLTNYSNSNPSTLLLNMNTGGIIDQHSSFNYVTLGNIQTSTSNVKFGTGSLRFTGTSGAYLQSFQSLPALQWWLGSYTIECWLYANAFSQGGNSESTVIGNMAGASTTTYWSFGPISAGTVRWYYYNGSAQNLTTSTTLSTGQWYHLAFVNNSGSLAIYINGTSAATGSISGTPQASAATPLTIGSSNSVTFNGYLDDVRITKYARYTGNFTPPTNGDIAQ